MDKKAFVMKRKIKFRGKHESSGEWVFGGYFETEDKSECCVIEEGKLIYHVEPDTVGQYTGHKDKHKQEIYEGDILRSDDYPFSTEEVKDNYLGVAYFSDVNDRFQVKEFVTKDADVRGISNFNDVNFYDLNLRKMEIIGNIFDNKRLFRDTDKSIMKWFLSKGK